MSVKAMVRGIVVSVRDRTVGASKMSSVSPWVAVGGLPLAALGADPVDAAYVNDSAVPSNAAAARFEDTVITAFVAAAASAHADEASASVIVSTVLELLTTPVAVHSVKSPLSATVVAPSAV